MIRYTSEDSDICVYCGKKVSVNEFSGMWRMEIRGNMDDVLNVINHPICSRCAKILEKYWNHETQLALYGGVIEE